MLTPPILRAQVQYRKGIAFLFIFLFLSHCPNCKPGTEKKTSGRNATTGETSPIPSPPPERKLVKAAAVAEWKEKTDDPLNDWYFWVRLFETNQTFAYRLKIQFEEVRGEDTLRFPNFGVEPRPRIQKGKERYTCIIGFMDRENHFRPFKMVSVKEGRLLRLTTLNHYGIVRTTP
jgi:hypothetical protein